MSNYKILAITAVLAGTLTSCSRAADDGISPISQTSAAVTVGETLEKIPETTAGTAGKVTEKTPETMAGTELQADDILDGETEEKLRRALADYINETDPLYANFDPSRAEIEKYYGRYGGCEVFLSRYSGGEEEEDYWYVAGYEFYFPCLGYSIYVHKDGNIWELDKAYEEGIITEEDVKKIAEKHGGVPAEKTEPDEVGVTMASWRETERARRKELCEFRREFVEFIGKTNPEYAELDPADVQLQLCASADGWEIFLPLRKDGAYDDAEERFTIGGYEFYFPCLGYELYVGRDGEFYELENAYELGYIGDSVVAAAAEDNHIRYFWAFE